jgi:hypothetical protein
LKSRAQQPRPIGAPQSVSRHRAILRHARVHSGKKRLIGGSPAEAARDAQAELLYDGDKVIGVRLRCACGKATEIYFEYGDSE